MWVLKLTFQSIHLLQLIQGWAMHLPQQLKRWAKTSGPLSSSKQAAQEWAIICPINLQTSHQPIGWNLQETTILSIAFCYQRHKGTIPMKHIPVASKEPPAGALQHLQQKWHLPFHARGQQPPQHALCMRKHTWAIRSSSGAPLPALSSSSVSLSAPLPSSSEPLSSSLA